MAAVLTRSVTRVTKANKRFSSLFRSHVAPRVAELEALRERQRQRFLGILVADAADIVVVLPLLWRLDFGFALLAVVFRHNPRQARRGIHHMKLQRHRGVAGA